MAFQLLSPDGKLIVSTLDTIPGKALINGASGREKDGTFDLEWYGETKVIWDEQKTIEREGQRVFLDEEGSEWLESQLVMSEDDDSEDKD